VFKKFAPPRGHWIGNGVQSLSAGLAMLPFAVSFQNIGNIEPTWRLFTALAYLVLFVSVLAYLLWFRMLTVSGATAASSYHFMMPPLGLLFGWLLLGEHVSPTDSSVGIYFVRGHSAVKLCRALRAPAPREALAPGDADRA
jgi:drug/metabolite transporter (DMT)-like permease